MASISGLLTNSSGFAWIGGNTSGEIESGRIRRSCSRASASEYECEIKHFVGNDVFIEKPRCGAPIATRNSSATAGLFTDGKQKKGDPPREGLKSIAEKADAYSRDSLRFTVLPDETLSAFCNYT